MNSDQLSNGLGQLARPTLAASVLKTFGLVTKIGFGVSWLVTLPAELILHRRVGKRYMNTVFFVMSMVLLSILAAVLAGRFGTASAARQWGQTQPQEMLAVAQAAMASMRPFSVMMLLVIVGFVVHYRGNRQRFGTPEQGHSCDFGVPWLAFPPLLTRWPGASALADRLQAMDEAAERESQDLVELEGWSRWSAWWQQTLALLRQHAIRGLRGEVPHGPVNWFAVSVVEPAIILTVGGLLTAAGGPARPFGIYLVLLALALLFKACVHRVEWREFVYNDHDQHLEAEAMRDWREGKSPREISRVFTVPILRAVLPPAGVGAAVPAESTRTVR